MKRNKISGFYVRLLMVFALVLLSGCVAGQAPFQQGNKAFLEKDYDQAVVDFLAAVEKNPTKSEYRLRLNQASDAAALHHKSLADKLFQQDMFQEALQEYSLAFDLDSSLYTARDGLEKSRNQQLVVKMVGEAQALLASNRQLQALELVDSALTRIPEHKQALALKSRIKQSRFALIDGVELDVTSTDPIDLNFNKTKLPDVFKILTKLSGINFIIDADVRDAPTTLSLEQATFAQALELLLRMNKLDKKILNSKTIILYPKTREKQKQFDDQVIQTIYLSHLDAKKAVNMLRTMLQIRKIFVQEELNAIVIRDHPEVIRLAQKLLEANDRGNAEVVFDLELIEVNHNDTRELGLKLSNYSIGAGMSLPDSGLIVDTGLGSQAGNLVPFGSEFSPLNGGLDSFYSLPTATFRFMKTLVDAEILANPKIRVRNNKKARVHVGSREPVITVTTNDGVSSDSVQYIDVGVKLDIEPRVQLDNTIVTKISLEVSNVSGRETTGRGTAVITISSTTADTTLTLKDGEQTIIGGLIRDDHATTKNKIPLLGDIPFLGEIFNGTDKTKSKREILLSITPHIVKAVQVPTGETAAIWSGGEDDLKFGRNFGTFVQDYKTGQDMLNPAPLNDETPASSSSDTPAAKPEQPATKEEISSVDRVDEPTVQKLEPVVIKEEVITAQPAKRFNPLLFIDGPRETKVGEEIAIEIVIERVEGLANAPMTIAYNPDLLEFVDVAAGSFLSAKEGNTIFSSDLNAETGQIVLNLQQPAGSAGASGQGKLFTLRFKTLQEGEAQISPLKVSFSDVHGGTMSVDSFGFVSVIKP